LNLIKNIFQPITILGLKKHKCREADYKAGKKRLKVSKEKTQRQARNDSKANKKRLKHM
jgi:hypothetical protein